MKSATRHTPEIFSRLFAAVVRARIIALFAIGASIIAVARPPENRVL